MKSPIVFFAAAIAAALVVACAPVRGTRSSRSATQLTGRSGVLTAEQLANMRGVSAFDALRTMPGYYARVRDARPPRFTLILDGLRVKDLDVLNSIRAVDLFEIR